MGLNIFFDVDYTLISYDGSLRPGVHEIFQQLRDDGHQIHIWSGMGKRWDVIDRHKLGGYIEGCHIKPLENHHKQLQRLNIPVMPDFCVDDHQEIIDVFGGYRIRAYDPPNKNDQEMTRVYDAIAQAILARAALPE
ncbi:MAG: hypothetical protein NTZ05_08295 [Chloroflexi bacterium]|nr:hypothetical protein [Chloroflexota bacterium]